MSLGDRQRAIWREADRLFCELIDLAPDQRSGFLDSLETDEDVRQCLEALLVASDQTGPLDGGLQALRLKDEERPSLKGRQLGPWTLDEEIGRGGMSVVYRAHRQESGFEQTAAVKLLGWAQALLGGHQRFVQEQRILAQLQHPHIARFLDGGVADDGTPWLAMEFVDGQRIDRYANQHTRSAEERVRLFLAVLEALGYAHRNLIVHRDIKPSNILVDANGHPRLLDFGIAKLVSEELTGHTATRIMTPEYAAPEQLAGHPVTTSADIFAAGGVLFTLLTGQTAFGSDRSRTVPPPPSSISDVPVDQDLDNIVLMALREEPERRYPAVEAFAADLRGWLAGRPVVASPDSARYRFGKWIKRHSLAVAAAALVALVTAAGVLATLHQARQARHQAQLAQAQSEFLLGLFENANVLQTQGEDPTISSLLEEASEKARRELTLTPMVQGSLLRVIGTAQRELGRLEPSRASLSAALEAARQSGDPREQALIERAQAILEYEVGAFDAAIGHLRRSVVLFQAAGTPREERERNLAETDLATYLALNGQSAEADTVSAELKHFFEARGRHDEPYEYALVARAITLDIIGRSEESLALLERVLDLRRKRLSGPHPLLASILHDYAFTLNVLNRREEAAAAYEETVELKRQIYRGPHPSLLSSLNNLSSAYGGLGRHDEAAEIAAQVTEGRQAVHGADHVLTAYALVAEAAQLGKASRFADALQRLDRAVSIFESQPSLDPELGNALTFRSEHLLRLGRAEQARQAAEAAEAVYSETLGTDHFRVSINRVRWARAHLALGDWTTAESVLADAPEQLARHPTPLVQATSSWAFLTQAQILTKAGREADARTAISRIEDIHLTDEERGEYALLLNHLNETR